MLKEQRKHLDGERRKRVIAQLLSDISETDQTLYYQSTSVIALTLFNHIHGDSEMIEEDRALMQPLSQRDIEVLLSLH